MSGKDFKKCTADLRIPSVWGVYVEMMKNLVTKMGDFIARLEAVKYRAWEHHTVMTALALWFLAPFKLKKLKTEKSLTEAK